MVSVDGVLNDWFDQTGMMWFSTTFLTKSVLQLQNALTVPGFFEDEDYPQARLFVEAVRVVYKRQTEKKLRYYMEFVLYMRFVM